MVRSSYHADEFQLPPGDNFLRWGTGKLSSLSAAFTILSVVLPKFHRITLHYVFSRRDAIGAWPGTYGNDDREFGYRKNRQMGSEHTGGVQAVFREDGNSPSVIPD